MLGVRPVDQVGQQKLAPKTEPRQRPPQVVQGRTPQDGSLPGRLVLPSVLRLCLVKSNRTLDSYL
jgi:hypothetical protein